MPALLTPPQRPPPPNQHSHQPLGETIRGNSTTGKHEEAERKGVWGGGGQQEIKYLEESKNREVIKKGENERLGQNAIIVQYKSN